MGVAAAVSLAEVADLVLTWTPKLVADAGALATLWNNASAAATNAVPDGSVNPADWAALLEQTKSLDAKLDQEIADDAAAATTSGGAA